ncbi:hypothetical protein D9M68_940780 [compost metagenome]
MRKDGFGFVVMLVSAALMSGCSSYNHQRAANDFFDGATNSADAREKQAEQRHQKPDSSLLPDVIIGVLNVGLQWLVSSEDSADNN